jgi:hypothetical protein
MPPASPPAPTPSFVSSGHPAERRLLAGEQRGRRDHRQLPCPKGSARAAFPGPPATTGPHGEVDHQADPGHLRPDLLIRYARLEGKTQKHE